MEHVKIYPLLLLLSLLLLLLLWCVQSGYAGGLWIQETDAVFTRANFTNNYAVMSNISIF
jgi:hypothetical protein